MFFHAIISSLVYLPNQIFDEGIHNCKKSVDVPFCQLSQSAIPVKEDKLPIVQRTLESRLKNLLGPLSEDDRLKFYAAYKDLLSPDAWTKPQTKYVVVNGYSAVNAKSIMLILAFSNINLPQGLLFKIQIQTAQKEFTFPSTFIQITTFDIENDKVLNVKEAEGYVDFRQVAACIPSVAPFYFGSALFAFTDFVNPSIDYIGEKYATFAKQLKFPEEEILTEVESFKKFGSYDFKPLQEKILKICLTTPTPVPTPEVPETPEKPEDALKEIIGSLKKNSRKVRVFRRHNNKAY